MQRDDEPAAKSAPCIVGNNRVTVRLYRYKCRSSFWPSANRPNANLAAGTLLAGVMEAGSRSSGAWQVQESRPERGSRDRRRGLPGGSMPGTTNTSVRLRNGCGSTVSSPPADGASWSSSHRFPSDGGTASFPPQRGLRSGLRQSRISTNRRRSICRFETLRTRQLPRESIDRTLLSSRSVIR